MLLQWEYFCRTTLCEPNIAWATSVYDVTSLLPILSHPSGVSCFSEKLPFELKFEAISLKALQGRGHTFFSQARIIPLPLTFPALCSSPNLFQVSYD